MIAHEIDEDNLAAVALDVCDVSVENEILIFEDWGLLEG